MKQAFRLKMSVDPTSVCVVDYTSLSFYKRRFFRIPHGHYDLHWYRCFSLSVSSYVVDRIAYLFVHKRVKSSLHF